MRLLSDPALFKTAAFINGAWITEGGAGSAPLRNPATGEVIAHVPQLDEAQVGAAIRAAEAAFTLWKQQAAKERAIILRRWFDLIEAHGEDLARLIVLEEGKPLAEARAEIAYAASFVEWFAEEAKRIKGDVLAAPEASRRLITLKEPVGVCAAITPWNFPAAMITRKAAPALAAGCAMIVKPAEQTPLTAFALAELAARAGAPDGVLNIVTGDPRRVGAVLTQSMSVRKLSFTGSTEIGRLLSAQCAATIKRVSLELGGNAPVIVFDDADLETAAAAIIAAKFRNSGQACISANRIYVQSQIYAALAAKLTARVGDLKLGDGFTTGVQIGPLIDANAVAKVEDHIADAVERGARVAVGGRRHARGGFFFEPTILIDTPPDALICREETFGPVLPLVRFSADDEAIALANASEYGLAAYLFSSNDQRLWRAASQIESGMVGVNTGSISNEVAPFGGVKQSGIGREGSSYGIEEYLELKYIAWEGAR